MRAAVLEALGQMLHGADYTKHLQPHMPQVTTFVLRATADADSSVAQAACEYWSLLVEEAEPLRDSIRPHLPACVRLRTGRR